MSDSYLKEVSELQPKVLKELTAYFAMLPGIGVKTATRLAYYMILNFPDAEKKQLGDLISNLSRNYKVCSFCNVISNTDPCPVCADIKRDHSRILIVETSLDVYKIENTRVYNGLYYVMSEDRSGNLYTGGRVTDKTKNDYQDFISKDKVEHFIRRICNLVSKLQKAQKLEIIFGLPVNMNSQGILHTIKDKLFKKCKDKVKVTRLAVGLSVGADIEFVDPHTLSLAIQKRQDIDG